MGYTNSPLVVHTKLSPNHSGQRTNAIDRITPHCVVGQCTAEGLGEWFEKKSTQASSNYGIDKNGRVGMYVEEKNRSWCTSSNANDQRAITIECASGTKEPYEMYDVVYERLIDLCTDICKRNGKTKLLWFGDKNKTLNYKPASNEMVITVHRWFANKSCPGNWLYSRLGDLAAKVTARLGGKEETKEEPKVELVTNFPVCPFTVQVIIDDLNYRSAPSMDGAIKGQTGKGIFTILEVKDGWGKLKSGVGWIYLENPSYAKVIKSVANTTPKEEPWVPKVGDIVKFNGGKHYVSANASTGSNCSAGEAKITRIYQLGKSKHPYHLVRTGKTGPYGWCDKGSFTKK